MDSMMRSPKFALQHTVDTPDHNWQFEAIGTHWQIDVAMAGKRWLRLQQRIEYRIEQFDQVYSRFRDDSQVWAMSQRAGKYKLPADAVKLIQLYAAMYRLTDGAVTPLIGQTLADAGYDAKYRLTPHHLQRPPAWEDTIRYAQPMLTLSQPALLDFGAAGKGYLVDIVSQLIADYGVDEYCVDAGGDMYYHSQAKATIAVGLEDPNDASQAIGVVTLTNNQAICGSAGNKRAWGNYHHILDPRSLRSPRHIAAVWTIADNTLVADGMATCLFFVEPDRLIKHYNFQYLIVYDDNRYAHSPNFPGEIFTSVNPPS
jgi:thiamine biosynthesis lipoprotein